MKKDPIFIGGLMKSGTSLLRKLLGRHPSIFGGLETHWYSSGILLEWQDSQSTRQNWLREFFEVSEEELTSIKKQAESGADFFDRFMWYCTNRADRNRWVEKTPDNIKHINLIWENWPRAKILHVLRDYRDVYASWKRNKKLSLPEFIDQVHLIINTVGDLAGKQTELYKEVVYDELVLSPKSVLQEVLVFLGEPWIEGFDEYQGDTSDYEKVLKVTGKKSPTTISLSKPIFTGSIGQWKKILSHSEIATIEKELGPYMAQWDWK